MKVSKPTNNPPVTAPGKVKIDESLENPRGYLKDIDERIAMGHTKVEGDLDPMDKERNQHRMGRFNQGSGKPGSNAG